MCLRWGLCNSESSIPMIRKTIDSLSAQLSNSVPLSKNRLEVLSLMIVGMTSSRTPNLSHISSKLPTAAKIPSTYRRIQRFFSETNLVQDWSALLIVQMLNLPKSWDLCLDRTDWKIGSTHMNILVLAVVTRRYRLPLMWTVLNKPGCSNTDQRIDLMKRYLNLFGASSIKTLLADREFIGAGWLSFLVESGVQTAIRLRSNQRVTLEDGTRQKLSEIVGTKRTLQTFRGYLEKDEQGNPVWLNFASKYIEGKKPRRTRDREAKNKFGGKELLIVATNGNAGDAMKSYKRRWAIECLFADAKTKGFNLEDTRLTITKKLDLLMSILALAMTWATKIGSAKIGTAPRPRGSHGRYKKSVFRTGFDELRRLIQMEPEKACWYWRRSRLRTS